MVAKNERSKDRRKAGRATWRVPTLIRRALTAKNEDSAWECIMVLHRRRTPEVFTAATELCRSKKALEREVGADILSQARAPDKNFSIDALKVLHRMLRNESDPGVLNCVLEAIGHAQDAEDTRGLRRITSLKRHQSEDVRFGVVMALKGREDSISIATLIQLSRDPDSCVRDWATFGLGTLIELDTARIRAALRRRLDDADDDARGEAILGLAKRRDPSAKEAMLKELAKDDVTRNYVFEAAAEYGDPSLIPHLQRHVRLAQANRMNGHTFNLLTRSIKDLRKIARTKSGTRKVAT